MLIAGFLYIADFGSMLQLRRNDPSRQRRIKRDLSNAPKKGIAGLRLNQQQDEEPVFREIRGAERPASPASDTTGEYKLFNSIKFYAIKKYYILLKTT